MAALALVCSALASYMPRKHHDGARKVRKNQFRSAADMTIERRVSYEVWCQCARLLLGSAAGDRNVQPDLYAAGMTPLAAVREMVFGSV
jgi:hypothetical protein